MERDELYEAIFKRKSVRKYDPNPLDEATMAKLDSFIAQLKPMYPDIHTEAKMMQGDVLRGFYKVHAPHYLSFFSETKNGFSANAGFMLQQLDLFLSKEALAAAGKEP